MIKVTIDKSLIDELSATLKDKIARLPKEINAAINAAAVTVRKEAAQALRKAINVPAKLLKKVIYTQKSSQHLLVNLRLWAGHPFPLKYFSGFRSKLKQANKARINKAFIVNKLGGNVFIRTTNKRLPIKKQYGPAPGDVFISTGVEMIARNAAKRELTKQIKRRIELLMLRQKGEVAEVNKDKWK
jgi:hypothetical protein